MAGYVEQIECLQCSQNRSFVLHGPHEQRILGQVEAARLARSAVLTCARCGSSSLIRGWTDAAPYAAGGHTRTRSNQASRARTGQTGAPGAGKATRDRLSA